MFKKLLLLVFILCISLVKNQAQSCGTHVPADFFKKPKTMALIRDSTNVIPFISLPKVNLSISVYFTWSQLPTGALEEAIDSLNDAFKPTGISFTVCSVTNLEEIGFSLINNATNEDQLTSLHSVKNTINLYFSDNLMNDGSEVCGYAYLPSAPSYDYIFIKIDCNIATTLIHEMGHYFGLLHPHETAGGIELVDESNCTIAGDLVCDTKASPNLYGLVNESCEYTASYTDTNGDYFLPSVSNYMSYSTPECRCKFTPGQYKRMVEYFWMYRTHLH